ncbi:hypothetical protein [Primorskyibacter sp. S87]|uniref:hypothetical protein n=1 Tax=Primorskyibacter sp. S87 TaxID=3415126 RepID=UPI003C7BC153
MTETHPTHSIHKEIVVEERIVSQLVNGLGYIESSPEAYGSSDFDSTSRHDLAHD